MLVGSAYVAVKPDARGFGPDAEKSILGSVSSVAKKASAIIGGAFAVQRGFDFLKGAVADARESNKVAAQTAQVIKSTGGAAKITASEVAALASAISKKTGIDDEQIQTAENLLLTFKSVRNEAGRGNDIFNQAARAVTDLSKVFGGLDSSAVQVGKALENPLTGITALQRVGVTFSESQKDIIKNFVETGRVAEAQKVILAEINSQVGGQAAAQATAADRLRVVYGNLREDLGNRLIPVIDKVARFLADRLPGALDTLGRGFERLSRFVSENRVPLVAAGVAVAALVSPITVAVGALAFLYLRFQSVRTVVGVVGDALGSFARSLRTRFAEASTAVGSRLDAIREAVSHVLVAIRFAVETLLAPIVLLWRLFGEQIKDVVGIAFDQIGNIVGTAMRVIGDVIDLVLALINGDWGKAWDALKDIPAAVLGLVRDSVVNALRLIRETVEAGMRLVTQVFSGAWNLLKDIVRTGVAGVVNLFLGLAETFVKGAAKAFGWIPGIGGKLKDAAKEFEDFRDSVNAAILGIGVDKPLQQIAFELNKITPQTVTVSVSALRVRAQGGPVWPGEGFLVGEKGPEWFEPITRGNIVPFPRSMDVAGAAQSGSGPTVGQLVVNEARTPFETGIEVARRLRAEAWVGR